MVQSERDLRQELVLEAARRMMVAARTAPKGKGIDVIEIGLVTGEDIKRLSAEMEHIYRETGFKFLLRDAEKTCQQVQALNCGHCGFPTCGEKPALVPCAINSVDLGIAIGSACAMAADMRVDTRVMFSAGLAAQRLGMLGDCKCVMAIPVSCSSKNPFFDRKPKA